MLSWFRRQRLVAALMLAVNPALVGSWVSAHHPCPVRDAVVAAPSAEHDGMMMSPAEMAGMAEQGAPAHEHSQGEGQCTCIGQCLSAGIALPSLAGDETRVAVEITQHAAPSTQHTAVVPTSRPLDLLPPSTAPPTV